MTGYLGVTVSWWERPLLPNGHPRNLTFANGTVYKTYDQVKFWECEKDKCIKRRLPCKIPIRKARDKCLWTLGWRNGHHRGANYSDPINYTAMQALTEDWDGALRTYH